MKLLIIVALIALSPIANAANAECQDLKWKLTYRDGDFGTYRGSVKPGTTVVHMELKNHKGKREVLGTGIAYPNPGGNWEINVIADRRIKKKFKAKFYCETY